MKKLLTFVTVMVLCLSAAAQQQNDSRKQFKNREKPDKEALFEKKCKKVADKLMLDDATAAKFIPVYKEYLNELIANFDSENNRKSDKEISDADIDSAVSDRFAKARKTVDIREKYYREFRKFLTARQAKSALKYGGRKKMQPQHFGKRGDNGKQLLNRLDFTHSKPNKPDENSQIRTAK
jgi:hypothetical protein